MKNIENWSKAICMVTIISGVIVSVIPKNKLSSAYKTLVAILLLYLFINPISSLIDDISSFSINSASYNEQQIYSIADTQVIDSGEIALSEKIESLLSENGYETSCDAVLTEVEDQVYSADIVIYGKFTEPEQADIIKIISEEVDTEIHISFSGEEHG